MTEIKFNIPMYEALCKSVKHWEDNWEKSKQGKTYDRESGGCALCILYSRRCFPTCPLALSGNDCDDVYSLWKHTAFYKPEPTLNMLNKLKELKEMAEEALGINQEKTCVTCKFNKSGVYGRCPSPAVVNNKSIWCSETSNSLWQPIPMPEWCECQGMINMIKEKDIIWINGRWKIIGKWWVEKCPFCGKLLKPYDNKVEKTHKVGDVLKRYNKGNYLIIDCCEMSCTNSEYHRVGLLSLQDNILGFRRENVDKQNITKEILSNMMDSYKHDFETDSNGDFKTVETVEESKGVDWDELQSRIVEYVTGHLFTITGIKDIINQFKNKESKGN